VQRRGFRQTRDDLAEEILFRTMPRGCMQAFQCRGSGICPKPRLKALLRTLADSQGHVEPRVVCEAQPDVPVPEFVSGQDNDTLHSRDPMSHVLRRAGWRQLSRRPMALQQQKRP
jgi:hypothetical protein